MSKTAKTLLIENALSEETKLRRIYGCPEVTIGFFHQGKADEHVDFMTMDSHGLFKCYEIKVSLADFKSDAKLSFYGHYNYLVIHEDLLKNIEYIRNETPAYVGIIVAKECSSFKRNELKENGVEEYPAVYLVADRKAKKQKLTAEDEMLLKDSLVRSLYWKMEKYKEGCDPVEQANLKADVRRNAQAYKEEHRTAEKAKNNLYRLIRKLIREGRSEEELEEYYV
ncbi:MAG: hypothetical protein IJI66_10480 [Erysipelotrichaceae bacterium]|nr:hypothetical protein [Erysipelotrichaceae bacterium]